MRLIILGPPGSGKGTMAKFISKKLKLEHISTGEIFRDELSKKSKLGLEAYKKFWSKGLLVPDRITIKLLKNKLVRIKDGFILDGFPRTVSQAEILDRFCKIDKVILLDVPISILKKRLLKRSKIEKRSDDIPKIIKERFKEYEELSLPLVNYYKDKMVFINGNRMVEEIGNDIIMVLKQKNGKFSGRNS